MVTDHVKWGENKGHDLILSHFMGNHGHTKIYDLLFNYLLFTDLILWRVSTENAFPDHFTIHFSLEHDFEEKSPFRNLRKTKKTRPRLLVGFI